MISLESCFCPIAVVIGVLVLIILISSHFSRQAAAAKEEERSTSINSHSDWGIEVREQIIRKEVALGMTEEMVTLSWGQPASIGPKVQTAQSTKARWVYGTERRGAKYVWFTNGKVAKIREEGT